MLPLQDKKANNTMHIEGLTCLAYNVESRVFQVEIILCRYSVLDGLQAAQCEAICFVFTFH
jgi:hypothetical protein